MKFALFAIKFAISAVLIWVLLGRVNFAPVAHFLQSDRAFVAIAVCLGVLAIQAFLAALRLRWIMQLVGLELPIRLGFSIWMIGLFISQTLVTFIAGDAARIWQLIRRGYTRRLSGSTIFLERALGFAVLMAMVLSCTPFLLTHGATGHVAMGLITVAAACAAGIIGFVVSGFLNRAIAHFLPSLQMRRFAAALVDVTSAARHLAVNWQLTRGIVALTVIMHLCNGIAFYVLGRAAGIDLDLLTTIAISLPVMLIALLPIAVAGWGVREGAAVVGYGLFGVTPEAALTVSVTFGLTLLIVSLPGALFLWISKPATHARVVASDGRGLPA